MNEAVAHSARSGAGPNHASKLSTWSAGGMGRLGASIPAPVVRLARAVTAGTGPRALGKPEARQVAPGRVGRSLHRALAPAFLADVHAGLVDFGGGPHGEGPGPRPPRPE